MAVDDARLRRPFFARRPPPLLVRSETLPRALKSARVFRGQIEERSVETTNASIGRIHRADKPQARWQLEVLRVEQVDRLVSVLEEEHQLAEDPWEVSPVHLVDYEDGDLIGVIKFTCHLQDDTVG